MAAKVSIIKLDQIVKSDGSVIVTPALVSELADGKLKVAGQSVRSTIGNEDLFVRLTVDADLDKNAQLIVPPTHVAMLIKDGLLLQTLESGKYFVYDKKSDLAGIFIKKFVTDSVEIIYITKTAKLRMPWGTPQPLDLRDPVTDLPIRVRAFGEFEVQVSDPRKFYLELVGMDKGFDIDMLQERLLNKLMSKFQPSFAKSMREKNITYTIVDEYTDEIAQSIAPVLGAIFLNDYGVNMYDFFIKKITVPDETKAEIEEILKERKNEQKQKEVKSELKQDCREALAELERLEDKQWEKAKYLHDLEAKDYEKYLEVCKIIGWKDGQSIKQEVKKISCAKCEHALTPSDRFCPKCGASADGKVTCGNCGKTHKSDASFCSGCGKKL